MIDPAYIHVYITSLAHFQLLEPLNYIVHTSAETHFQMPLKYWYVQHRCSPSGPSHHAWYSVPETNAQSVVQNSFDTKGFVLLHSKCWMVWFQIEFHPVLQPGKQSFESPPFSWQSGKMGLIRPDKIKYIATILANWVYSLVKMLHTTPKKYRVKDSSYLLTPKRW